MTVAGARTGDWRRLGGCLAVLALVLNLLVPPGFMVAGLGQREGLVICTGHGPQLQALADASADHDTHKTGKAGHGGVCAFAGHGVSLSAPLWPQLATRAVRPSTPPPSRAGDLAPGRGLAAPPPPSQAPPSLL